MSKCRFLLFAAIWLAPVPAHASWKGFCGWVAGLANVWQEPPSHPTFSPSPVTELEIRLDRLFRDKRRESPEGWSMGDFLLPEMNVELIAKHRTLYGRKAFKGPEIFTDSVPVEKIFLLVHQVADLQMATVDLLSRNEMAGIPVLALGGDMHPVSNSILARYLSLLQVSRGGEMYHLTFNTSELHLAGGYFGLCLNTAAQEALASMLSYPERTSAKIVLHPSVVYSTFDRTLKASKDELPLDHYLQTEKAIVEDFLPEGMGWRQLDRPGYVYQNRQGQVVTIEVPAN